MALNESFNIHRFFQVNKKRYRYYYESILVISTITFKI